jgi:coatomer protein complex subunit gamma
VDALYEALESHMMNPQMMTKPFDITIVPDAHTYATELRTREAAAAAEALAAKAAVEPVKTAAPTGVSTPAVLEGPRPEFSSAVAAIMDPASLGKLQHVCKPQMLTEAEAEYTVQLIKHVFGHHTVFEFYVTNTVEAVELANVQIKLGNVDPSVWTEVGSVPISSIAFGQGKSAFTILSRHKATPTATFPASLHFTQREDGDPVGFPDDFSIEHIKVQVADYVSPRPLAAGQFPRAWDSLGTFEVVQKNALNYIGQRNKNMH